MALVRMRTRVCVFSFLLVAVPVSWRAASLEAQPSSTLSNTSVGGTKRLFPFYPACDCSLCFCDGVFLISRGALWYGRRKIELNKLKETNLCVAHYLTVKWTTPVQSFKENHYYLTHCQNGRLKRLAGRVKCSKFQSSLLFIYFRYGPNTCLHSD